VGSTITLLNISKHISKNYPFLQTLIVFQLTITLNFGVFAISEMEMNIVAAERVTEYTSLPSEVGIETFSASLSLQLNVGVTTYTSLLIKLSYL
jgi:hypothetical protein